MREGWNCGTALNLLLFFFFGGGGVNSYSVTIQWIMVRFYLPLTQRIRLSHVNYYIKMCGRSTMKKYQYVNRL